MAKVDLSVMIDGIKFKNPIIPGSSEIAFDEASVKRCIDNGVGGIVTKTYTYVPAMATRPRPTHAHYQKFGLSDSWETFVRQDTAIWQEAVEKHLPGMVKLCRDAGIPLIVSIGGDDKNPDAWIEMAKAFKDVGADILELNFSCPQTEHVKDEIPIGKTVGENFELTAKIIREAKKVTGIPIFPKLSPTHEPAQAYAKSWFDAGASGIAAHNAPLGILFDLDNEEPFCAPYICGYLPGRAYLPESLARIVQIKQFLPDAVISGIGGVFEPEDVIQYLLAGCITVQVCSGIYNRGYALFGSLVEGLEKWMENKGYTKIGDFSGNGLKKLGEPAPESHPIPFPTLEERSRYYPTIDLNKCDYCGICADTCLYEVIKCDRVLHKITVDDEKCWGCGFCVGICPIADTVKLIDRKTKEVVWDNHGTAKTLKPVA